MKSIKFVLASILSLSIGVGSVFAQGNTVNESFYQAKKALEKYVYTEIPQKTIYCNFDFELPSKKVVLVDGFETQKHVKRAERIEWEHVVPAENFGRTFSEWREGHPLCVDKKGKSFKGRKCAEEANREFRLMQADMYNLYPAVGAVNASRSNFNFTQFSKDTPSSFGICEVKIYDRKVEVPEHARGKVARAYLYMEDAYPRYKMSKSNRKLMQAWNKMYPVTLDECTRTKIIESMQQNENRIVKELCISANLWE